MKTFYAILVLVFLTSCGENSIVTNQPNPKGEASQEIAAAISELPAEARDGRGERPQGERPERGGNKGQKAAPTASYEGGEITAEEIEGGKVEELSTTYISPKTEVIMNISYILDDGDKLSKIMVTSPNYTHMSKFNNGIQETIGMSLEDAAEYHVSGSTLSTVAFKKVLKSL